MLSKRERYLLLALAVVVVCGVLYFAVAGLRSYEAGLTAKISARESTLRDLQALSAELSRLGNLPKSIPLKVPLIGHVETLSRRFGIDDRVQLNLIPRDKDEGVEIVEAKLDRLTLDEMVKFIHAVEDGVPPMIVEHLELAPSFRSKSLLRLTMRIVVKK